MADERRDERVRDYLLDPETRDEWLVGGWYADLITQAIGARTREGLTQKDIAEKLGTTQSVVARMENDFEGRVGSKRLFLYLLACGIMALSDTVSLDRALARLHENPSLKLKWESFAEHEDDAVAAQMRPEIDAVSTEVQAASASIEEGAPVTHSTPYRSDLLASSSLYASNDSWNRLFSDVAQLSNTYAATVGRAIEGLADVNARLVRQLAPVWPAFEVAARDAARVKMARPFGNAGALAHPQASEDHEDPLRVPHPDLQPIRLATKVPHLDLMVFNPDESYDRRAARHQALPPGPLPKSKVAIS